MELAGSNHESYMVSSRHLVERLLLIGIFIVQNCTLKRYADTFVDRIVER
jgi:hypothetical protein